MKRASYGSFVTFGDADGNASLLQDETVRLPGLFDSGKLPAWLSRYRSPQQYAPELQPFSTDRFKDKAGPRDQVTESGPPMPDWRIPLYGVGVHEQRQSNIPVWTRYVEMESGNVRALQSDDPIFNVPADLRRWRSGDGPGGTAIEQSRRRLCSTPSQAVFC